MGRTVAGGSEVGDEKRRPNVRARVWSAFACEFETKFTKGGLEESSSYRVAGSALNTSDPRGKLAHVPVQEALDIAFFYVPW